MTPPATVRVASATGNDGTVDVAVHHLVPVPDAPPLLISHATGFHGRCYRALAAELGHAFDVWALDHRGHGATAAPPGWIVDWRGYGADTLAVARWLRERTGLPVTGFGHSMGGATLLMAAHAEAAVFSRLVVFEPIAFPRTDSEPAPEEFRLVAGARRRRATFDSLDAAFANYAAKPPLSMIRRDVLRDYVDYGFREAGSGVELCCAPDHEADTFASAATNPTFDLLPDIATATVVIGSGDQDGPALIAPVVAERLPAGRFVAHPASTHFGPFSEPAASAELLLDTPER